MHYYDTLLKGIGQTLCSFKHDIVTFLSGHFQYPSLRQCFAVQTLSL